MATIKGTDQADLLIGTPLDDRIIAGGGNDTIDGNEGDDIIAGGEGDDRIAGGGGNDTVTYGGLADDVGVLISLRDGTASGTDGADLLLSIENVSGSQYADDITGDNGDNILNGKGGHDIVKGGQGGDGLLGGLGDDTLIGGRGMDTLYGGKGQDRLTGGDDADTFAFASIGQTRGARIMDLVQEDFVDLSGIDADANPGGDQAFVLVEGFSGTAGELVVKHSAGKDLTFIRGDVDGDGVKDFQLEVRGDAGDFNNFVL